MASYAQQNLVPNGDFEEYDTCQTGLGQLYHARYWTNPIFPISASSPDYYNACNPYPLFSVPANAGGYEFARSGMGYTAICIAAKGGFITNLSGNFREYLQVELLDTLIEGSEYCFKFYVSACDSMNFVSNNIGTYFSINETHDSCSVDGCNLLFVPQFENSITNSLDSRNGWTEITGTFIALGGERYLIIGNFRDSTNTNMTITNWTTDISKAFAVYYVDDVSLKKCDTVSHAIENNSSLFFRVFPNPSFGNYFIESKIHNIENINIFDVVGNVIYAVNELKKNQVEINLSAFPNGIYILIINTKESFHHIKLIKN